MQQRYEAIKSKAWRNVETGRKISIYGTRPPGEWELIERGWTVRDNETNTVGMGRAPLATEAEAKAWADELNSPSKGPGSDVPVLTWTVDRIDHVADLGGMVVALPVDVCTALYSLDRETACALDAYAHFSDETFKALSDAVDRLIEKHGAAMVRLCREYGPQPDEYPMQLIISGMRQFEDQ